MVNMQVKETPPNALAIQLSFPISSKSDLKDSSIFHIITTLTFWKARMSRKRK